MTRRLRRIVLTAAVLPLVVLVGLRSAWASYACQLDGKVRAACCCPNKAKAERPPVDGAPRIEHRNCCDVSFDEPSVAPSAREAGQLRTSEIPLVLITEAAAPIRVTHAASPQSRIAFARPPPAVPLYLANRTILC